MAACGGNLPTTGITHRAGDSLLAHRFYAGQYQEIVAETIDAGNPGIEQDLAFVVGALTFIDRVDEARALFDHWQSTTPESRRSARTIAASRCFLGLAAARAGYFDRARPLLVVEGLRDRHAGDPWVRAIVFQGLAVYWYFTGRFTGAAQHALRALQAAHEANFLYAAMLATDLRGHALVQIGQLQRGIAMLEQAGKQARRLGLTNNAFAVETSIATYVAQFDLHAEVLEQLQELLRRKAHDSYSQRVLLIAATVQLAQRGRHDEAVAMLDAADRDALRSDTRRGKVASLLARIWVTRLQHGPAECRVLIDEGRVLVEERDIAYRAELLGHELACARATGDHVAVTTALAELRTMWRTTHHFMARAGLVQFDPEYRRSAFDEDERARVLRAVAQHDVTAISRLVSLGVFGLLPELLGLTPARRIVWIPANELLLLEDHGNVIARERPPRWCPVLLQLLSTGTATKQRIVETLWGIRAYHPELHDPPVRTTIHRLRAFLAPHAGWITALDGTYRSQAPLHVIGSHDLDPEPISPLWDEGHVPELVDDREPGRPLPSPALDTKHHVLSRLEELEHASVPQLARSLELSASTVLRALRELVDERRVERRGFARATRYQPR